MTIEQKIDLIIEEWSIKYGRAIFPLKKWVWDGRPRWEFEVHIEVNKIIKEADEVECLTSKSEYIRECKKYLMEK